MNVCVHFQAGPPRARARPAVRGPPATAATLSGRSVSQSVSQPRGGFVKIISVGIPTYAGMKTGF